MSIFLIRHGETEGNAARIVQRPESPLSERGAVQAERLARRLAREGIAQIVSSDLARAVTTATRLHDVTRVPLAFDPLLQERNFVDVRAPWRVRLLNCIAHLDDLDVLPLRGSGVV